MTALRWAWIRGWWLVGLTLTVVGSALLAAYVFVVLITLPFGMASVATRIAGLNWGAILLYGIPGLIGLSVLMSLAYTQGHRDGEVRGRWR